VDARHKAGHDEGESVRLFPSSDIGLFGRRQRHARGHRIPVSVVRRAAAKRDGGTVVTTDDFGADEVLPPGIGCRCCTVRGELQTALCQLLIERAHGRDLNRVVIHTDKDLLPILRTFVTERALGAEFYVEDFPSAEIGAGGSNICRFELTEGTPLSWEAFSRFIATLTALRGPDLLHVKGILNIKGCRGPVMVQIMQHLAHRPVELQAWPNDEQTSRLAFITRNVEEKTVRSLFDSIRKLG
jgi:G3E family GTPase